MFYSKWNIISAVIVLFCLFIGLAGTAQAVDHASDTSTARDTTTVNVVEKCAPSVVRVMSYSRGDLTLNGAGIIVDRGGYVLTEEHVTHGIDQIYVGFSDGVFLPAELLWQETGDQGTDLALLKVKGKHAFPELTLGPVSDLKVGETVILIGSPFGFDDTVSRGIVSKLNVNHFGSDHPKALIQTDVTINPGNSGGPMINALGEVIGLAELLWKERGGLGWGINADFIQKKLASHFSASKHAGVDHGLVVREKVLARSGAQRQAVMVTRVSDPAKKAGILKGDRILKVGSRLVTNRFDLERAFWANDPDDKVKVTIVREGKKLTVTLTLGGSGVDREEDD